MSEIFESFPSFLSPADLVFLGLYANRDQLYKARANATGPEFIKLGRKILYPKSSVIQFIECRLKRGCIPKKEYQDHLITNTESH